MDCPVSLPSVSARSIVLIAVLLSAVPVDTRAQLRIGSYVRAARVVYPLIRADSAAGRDTLVQISNLSAEPIEADCFYGTFIRSCSNDGSICESHQDCLSPGFCGLPDFIDVDFSVVLTARQPLQWRASVGLSGNDLPLPNGICSSVPIPCGDGEDCAPFQAGSCSASNAGTAVPPVAAEPFAGYLVCSARNADGLASDRNDLRGSATLLRLDDMEAGIGDAAQYAAIGIPAVTTQINGSPQIRYAECPSWVAFQHYFDGALEPIVKQADIFATLAMVHCGNNFRGTQSVPLGGAIINEYTQKFGGAFGSSAPHVVAPLSDNDAFGVHPTPTELSWFSLGWVAIMVEEHVDPNNVHSSQSAAWEAIYDRDVVLTSATATPTLSVPTPTRTPTPAPSSSGPEVTHFGLATAAGAPLPAGVSDLGSPLYEVPRGFGFVLVLEVRPGSNGIPLGSLSIAGALQIQSNRDLGDGSPEICDLGGVPGIVPTSFDTDSPEISDALDDFRCRFRDLLPPRSCTINAAGLPQMVSPLSELQVCSIAVLGRDLEFPAGDTVLTARWSDARGDFGAESRIVVRVGG